MNRDPPGPKPGAPPIELHLDAVLIRFSVGVPTFLALLCYPIHTAVTAAATTADTVPARAFRSVIGVAVLSVEVVDTPRLAGCCN